MCGSVMSRWRAALFVLLAYAAFRVVDIGLFALVGVREGLSLRAVLMSWDGGWFRAMALEGWPHEVARMANGTLEQSAWAWPPIYPVLGRLTSQLLGLSIDAVLIGINVVGCASAALILYLSLREPLGDQAGLIVAVAWSGMPAAPVLVMAYAEGLFIMLAFAAMWAGMRDRLLLSGALLVAAGLTKSSVLPFALALAIVAIASIRSKGAHLSQLATALGAVILAAVAVLLWPVAVAFALGSVDAYGQVQAAWNRSTIPGYGTLQAVREVVRTPSIEIAAGLLMTGVSIIAAVLVWRDTRVPVYLRLVGMASPAFLIATGAAFSSARLLLPDPALPTAIRRVVNGWVALILVIVGLTASRAFWIAAYLPASAGDPPA